MHQLRQDNNSVTIRSGASGEPGGSETARRAASKKVMPGWALSMGWSHYRLTDSCHRNVDGYIIRS
ncbi:uncharacterized protein MYCFIDRAFT_212170 [Pseudocercospora fijiensis CIRAD86]|uniref:Uncharacterized protein n=1 Tax=Pseudocercospora fijiensis (strain CIRAD86) TaxID=383855 RepID=M2YNF7_PSEFD|nr:uncharacterized protein MYCFIDRAFT_212170 [Pseudocercospora fijiensis CIRAD86]EME79235.1 hypothetical protein MYCFIDRAFT_212170 [Pseudocercospora fijiensis CIRAD86]